MTGEQPQQAPARADLGEDDIRTLVTRLARPHRSGGHVVERASLLAAGADFTAVMAWIEAQGGSAESAAPATARRGLHSAREVPADVTPRRFILPAGALR